MSELLPCPFCGGEPDEYEGEYGNGIYCMQCGAMVGEPIHLGFDIAERVSYEQAAEAWNTRADDYKQAAEYWQRMYEKSFTERTCMNVDEEYPYFECSKCGCHAVVGYGCSGSGLPNYCPNCGAKVVSE